MIPSHLPPSPPPTVRQVSFVFYTLTRHLYPFYLLVKVFYLEDVFASGQQELNAQLCDSLVERFVRPLLLGDWLSGRAGAMFPQVCVDDRASAATAFVFFFVFVD